ncbi:MAG: hypothetical protein JXB03_11760 [Spirochaetales bacterium]|nr:hypothetical protein [Spirochaetales bacterium]
MKKNDVVKHIHRVIGRMVTADTPNIRDEAVLELKRSLSFPPAVLSCHYVTETHWLKREALIIVDAFESVTNGMENPAILDQLKDIHPDSPFHPWTLLIKALSYLYHGNYRDAFETACTFPQDTPVHGLLPFFQSAQKSSGCDDPVIKKIEEALWDNNTFETSAVQQLREALDNDLEDVFVETGLLLFKHIINDYPETARRLGLWLLQNCAEAGYDISDILSVLQACLGIQEGCRIIALGLLDTDPDVALFFFLKSLTHAVHDQSVSDAYIREYLAVLSELLEKVETLEEDLGLGHQYWNSIAELAGSLTVELERQRNILIRYNPGEPKTHWLLTLENSNISNTRQPALTARQRRKETPGHKAVQLELF